MCLGLFKYLSVCEPDLFQYRLQWGVGGRAGWTPMTVSSAECVPFSEIVLPLPDHPCAKQSAATFGSHDLFCRRRLTERGCWSICVALCCFTPIQVNEDSAVQTPTPLHSLNSEEGLPPLNLFTELLKDWLQ